jgi:hypothetical protein
MVIPSIIYREASKPSNIKSPADKPAGSFYIHLWKEGKGRGETGGRTYGET